MVSQTGCSQNVHTKRERQATVRPKAYGCLILTEREKPLDDVTEEKAYLLLGQTYPRRHFLVPWREYHPESPGKG